MVTQKYKLLIPFQSDEVNAYQHISDVVDAKSVSRLLKNVLHENLKHIVLPIYAFIIWDCLVQGTSKIQDIQISHVEVHEQYKEAHEKYKDAILFVQERRILPEHYDTSFCDN